MPDINLLPWREQLREERKRQFTLAMLASSLCAILVAVLIHALIQNAISNQEDRNQYLQSQINLLDQQIKEIRGLREEKQRLLARMNIIEALQSGRPFIVHLFDTVPRIIPNGIYLESMKREGNTILLAGKAESNSQISQFMRKISTSAWLAKPSLNEIKTLANDLQYKNDFKLQLQQTNAEELSNTEPAK